MCVVVALHKMVGDSLPIGSMQDSLMNIMQKWSTQITLPGPHYSVACGFGMGILSYILHTLCKA